MPTFEKGQSGNPKGRPKGAKNKTTEEIRNALYLIIQGEIDELQGRLNSLSDKDRIAFLVKILPHVLPRMRDLEHRIEYVNKKD